MQISRRELLSGIVTTSLAACLTNDSNGPARPKFVSQDYAHLIATHSAGIVNYRGRFLALGTPTKNQTNELGERNHIVEIVPSSDPRSFLDLPNAEELFVGGIALVSSDVAMVTGDQLYQISLADKTYLPISLASNPMRSNGALRAGNKLFVTASHPISLVGALNVYDLSSDGTITGTGRAIATVGSNPTGLAERGSEIIVLHTGDYGPNSLAHLSFFDFDGRRTRDALLLGAMTAQNSGTIAITSDGNTAIIGTSDNSGRVFLVDLAEGKVMTSLNLPKAVRSFHSSIVTGEVDGRDYAFVTDYNSGLLMILDVEDRTFLPSINLVTDRAGPSLFHNGELIQTIPNAAVLVYSA
jgi:hypothetical protein